MTPGHGLQIYYIQLGDVKDVSQYRAQHWSEDTCLKAVLVLIKDQLWHLSEYEFIGR